MHKILIVGNPNVGKSTLFNSLTKSYEHTGNFHGVTVEEKTKKIMVENETYEVTDLPGMYSLNSISLEEEIAREKLLKNDGEILMLVDQNSIRKNLYLCQQLNELNIDYQLVVNTHKKLKNKTKIDYNKLSNRLDREVSIVDVKKNKNRILFFKKLNSTKNIKKNINYLEKYIKIVQDRYKIDKKTVVFALNGIFNNLNNEEINFIKSLFPQIIQDRYLYIDNILLGCLEKEKNFVYGESKWDKFLLNPIVAFLGFILTFFVAFYLIFFIVGPFISSIEEKLFSLILVNPIMNFLYLITDNIWLIEFIKNGVLNSIVTVLGFMPQTTLIFIFLTILEDSGIIARLAYVFDDFLCCFGLNGKALYVLLLGLGCNTMSTTLTRNLSDKNMRIKSAIINPYISCMARLPIYSLIASTFFGKKSFLIVFGLYILGLIVALTISAILNKTILKSKENSLLIEFPPLKGVDIKHILQVARINALDFIKRVFTVILSCGVIIWILTHTQFNLQYTDNITNSILFFFADKISFVFAPIGLNNVGVVCALFVGVLAKELIVSTMAICNNASSQKLLSASLLMSTSVINLSIPSAVSFLIFSLLYCPCVSNLAVIKKESGKFYMWFCVVSQFTIAYMISFLVYQALTKGILFAIVIALVIALIMVALYFAKTMLTKKCNGNCLKCNKKS